MLKWRNLRLSALAALLAALAVLACGSSTEIQKAPGPTATRAISVAKMPDPSDLDVATITYTAEEGFLPQRVDIEPGSQVRFANASDEPFWPASNIHPTHNILPEFDATEPIPPGETWAFTFNVGGFWRFHDHLAPEHGGLIVVLGDVDDSPPKPLTFNAPDFMFETPTGVVTQDYVNLFEDEAFLVNFMEQYGPEHTVRLLKEGEAYTGEDCHQRAHHLGRAAYDAFGAAAFALSGHECHAGSFHGATEALFASRGTANLEEDVATICGAADNPFFRHQCVHGVGHGLMAWTTYEIHDALKLCDQMSTEIDKGSCYSGVFMENVVGGLTGLMGHVTQYLKDDDPHFPCDIVGERYQAPCYFYQTSHMLKVFYRDFSAVAQACADAPRTAQRHCFLSYGRDVGGATRQDPATAIQYCSYAPAGPHRVACIEGAVQDRFWDESGAAEALSMCGLLVDTAEQDACYSTIIVRAQEVLTAREEFDAFCAQVETGWRKGCSEAGIRP